MFNPIKFNDYEKIQNMEKYLDEEGGVYIEPAKAFAFKCFDKYKEKFFINILTHPIIDKPEEKDLIDLDN